MKLITRKHHFTDQMVKNVIKVARLLISAGSGNRHSTAGRMFTTTEDLKRIQTLENIQFSSVHSCLTLCDPMNCSTPGLPVHHQFPEFTQTHVHRVGDAIQSSYPLQSLSPPPPIPPSIRVFSNESTLCIGWPKYWSFIFSTSPSNEYSGLISCRINQFDFLSVQGILKSLLQHHNSKASILQCSAFFMVHAHRYMTIGKTTAIWTM